MNEEYLKRMQEYLGNLFPKYLEALNNKNIRGLRLNKMVDKDYFDKIKDFKTEEIKDLPNSYKVLDEIKFGFHPLHHAGFFYIQDPSAMLPPLLIDEIKDKKLILDLCASPGGKAIELASICQDAIIVSNEIDYKRAQILYSNVERMGLKNVIVISNEPKTLLKQFSSCFDLILLDAPCSGEGMIRKLDFDLKWSQDYVNKCAKLDLELIDICDKLLKKDGLLIYSTCTFSKEEDENIILELVNNYQYETIEIKEELKKYVSSGFIPNTYRIYPFNNFGEGQFMGVLRKLSGNIKNIPTEYKNYKNEIFDHFCFANLGFKIEDIIIIDNIIYYQNHLKLNELKVLNYGAKLGEINKNIFKPDHYFFKAFGNSFKNKLEIDFLDDRVNRYLHGEQIEADVLDGYGVIILNQIPLGGFKAKNKVLNNLYPKGLRNF